MMSRSQKLLLALITYIPVLIMVVLGVAHFVGQIRRTLRHSEWIIVGELTQRLGRQVKIGSAEVERLGSVVAKDVAISDGPTFSSGKLLTARRIEMQYDFRGLVFGGQGAASVKSVEVVEPEMWLARHKDGTLNISDLLKPPPGPPGPPFAGTVRITGGTVVFRDYRVAAGSVPVVTRIDDIDALVDATRQPEYLVNASATARAGRFQSLRVSALYDAKTRAIRADVDARDLSMPFLAGYAGQGEKLQVLAGTADVAVGVSTRLNAKNELPHVTGIVQVRNASVKPRKLAVPVTGINGQAVIVGERTVINISGSLAGSRARASGSLSNFRAPNLNLHVTSPSVHLPALLQALRVRRLPQGISIGAVSGLDASVRGTVSNPMIEASGKVESFSGLGYWGRDIEFSMAYNRGQVDVRSVRLNFVGSDLRMSGSVWTTGTHRIALTGQLRGLEVSKLPLPDDYAATGLVDADFTVTGFEARPVVSANVSMTGVSVQGVKMGQAVASLRYSDGGVRVSQVKASGILGGSITASGSATRKHLNLNVTADGIQLADAGKLLKQPGVQGIVFARGRISGAIDAPTFTGAVEVFKARYEDHEVDYARALLTATRNGMRVSEATLRRYPAELALSGSLSGFGKDALSFRVAAHGERVKAEQVLALIGRELDVSGTVAGDLEATGVYLLHPQEKQFPFVDTIATGKAQLVDGTAFGYVVDSASTEFKFQKNTLALSNTNIAGENARLTLGGSVFADKKTVDLAFGLSGFDLTRVQERLGNYVRTAGVVNASGTLTGPWDKVTASATATADKLILNNLRFDQASVEAVYSGNTVETARLNLTRGEQVYEVNISGYDRLAESLGSGDIKITNGNVPDMWDFLVASPYLKSEDRASIRQTLQGMPKLTSGVVNGTGQLSGSLERPNGSLTVTATDVGVETRKIDSISVNASAKDGIITLEQLRASSGEMYVEATGSPLYEDGTLRLELTAQNIDLSRLRPWLGENTPAGILTADLSVEGDASAPHVTASVEIANPAFGPLALDRVRASRIEIAGDKIDFSERGSGIIFASGEHQVVAYGQLPWSWKRMSIAANEPIKLTAQLNKEDLSLLGEFTTEIDQSQTSGSLEAALDVTGTLSRPKVSGQVLASNGQLALKGFTNKLTNIAVDITLDTSFTGDQATNTVLINKLSLDSSMGGNLQVQGGRIVQEGGKPAMVEALIVAKGFGIAEKNAFGYKENTSTRIDAGIKMTGELKAPLIADVSEPGITLSNSVFGFAVPEATTAAEAPTMAFDPQFDITIDFGKNVVIEPPMMKLLVDGGGVLTGKFNNPEKPLTFGLDVNVKEGSLMLGASRLRVAPGSAIHVEYVPPSAPKVALQDFRATTSVTAANALGERDRYQITLSIAGQVTNMQIDMTSDPPGLSRQQMLAALGHVEGILGSSEGALRDEITSALTAVGSSTLFSPIERVFVEKLGFEQFSLEYSPISPLALFASTRIAGDLYVSYYQQLRTGVTATPSATGNSWILQLMYKVKGIYNFSYSIDDQQVSTIAAGASKAFN